MCGAVIPSGPAPGGFAPSRSAHQGHPQPWDGQGTPCPAVATVYHRMCKGPGPPSSILLFLGRWFVHGRTLTQPCMGILVAG